MRSKSILSMMSAMAIVLALGNVSGPANGEARKQAPAATAAGTTAGTAVRAWNTIAVDTLIGFPGNAGGAPPASQIHVAMVQGAVYDAVNATEPKHHRPYLLDRRFSARPPRTLRSPLRRTGSCVTSSPPCRTSSRRTGRRCWTRSARSTGPRWRRSPTVRSRTRESRPGRLPPRR